MACSNGVWEFPSRVWNISSTALVWTKHENIAPKEQRRATELLGNSTETTSTEEETSFILQPNCQRSRSSKDWRRGIDLAFSWSILEQRIGAEASEFPIILYRQKIRWCDAKEESTTLMTHSRDLEGRRWNGGR